MGLSILARTRRNGAAIGTSSSRPSGAGPTINKKSRRLKEAASSVKFSHIREITNASMESPVPSIPSPQTALTPRPPSPEVVELLMDDDNWPGDGIEGDPVIDTIPPTQKDKSASPSIQLFNTSTTVPHNENDRHSYDAEDASRGAGSSRNHHWFKNLPAAGWHSKPISKPTQGPVVGKGKSVKRKKLALSSDDEEYAEVWTKKPRVEFSKTKLEEIPIREQTSGRKMMVLSSDDEDHANKVAKKPSVEERNEEDDAELSIRLDHLTDIVNPNKHKLSDIPPVADATSDDSPLAKEIQPSPGQSEAEVDELLEDTDDMYEDIAAPDSASSSPMLEEERPVVPGESQKTWPSPRSFGFFDKKPTESPDSPAVLPSADMEVDDSRLRNVEENLFVALGVQAMSNSVFPLKRVATTRQGFVSDPPVENQTDSPVQVTPDSRSSLRLRPKFVDQEEVKLKALLDEYQDVIPHLHAFKGGYHRPGISPHDAPWIVRRKFYPHQGIC